MITLAKERLESLFGEFSRRKIIVIGDLMLDRYIWGSVSRISPEAPVPVIDIESESFRFGGAANVTYNIMTLGADVIPVGVIGEDGSGEIIKQLFKEKGFPTDGLIIDKGRPTTVKTRVIAHNQHVVRTDREARHGISSNIQVQIIDFLKTCLDDADGIIMEDYDKGLLVPSFIEEAIGLARERDKMVFVDPKFDQFFDYRDVNLFKPNRKEAADKLGFRLDTDEALKIAGEKLMSQLRCKALLITLGEEGMALFESETPWLKVPTQAVKVHDVSGAGDTVIATMAVAMTAGSSLREAATIANHAAGIVCGEVGIVPINSERLFDALREEIEV